MFAPQRGAGSSIRPPSHSNTSAHTFQPTGHRDSSRDHVPSKTTNDYIPTFSEPSGDQSKSFKEKEGDKESGEKFMKELRDDFIESNPEYSNLSEADLKKRLEQSTEWQAFQKIEEYKKKQSEGTAKAYNKNFNMSGTDYEIQNDGTLQGNIRQRKQETEDSLTQQFLSAEMAKAEQESLNSGKSISDIWAERFQDGATITKRIAEWVKEGVEGNFEHQGFKKASDLIINGLSRLGRHFFEADNPAVSRFVSKSAAKFASLSAKIAKGLEFAGRIDFALAGLNIGLDILENATGSRISEYHQFAEDNPWITNIPILGSLVETYGDLASLIGSALGEETDVERDERIKHDRLRIAEQYLKQMEDEMERNLLWAEAEETVDEERVERIDQIMEQDHTYFNYASGLLDSEEIKSDIKNYFERHPNQNMADFSGLRKYLKQYFPKQGDEVEGIRNERLDAVSRRLYMLLYPDAPEVQAEIERRQSGDYLNNLLEADPNFGIDGGLDDFDSFFTDDKNIEARIFAQFQQVQLENTVTKMEQQMQMLINRRRDISNSTAADLGNPYSRTSVDTKARREQKLRDVKDQISELQDNIDELNDVIDELDEFGDRE